jgi:general secretion pathway protein C
VSVVTVPVSCGNASSERLVAPRRPRAAARGAVARVVRVKLAIPGRLGRRPAGPGAAASPPAGASPDWASRAPQVVTVLLAAGVAAQLALLGWRFVPGAAPVADPPPPPPSAQSAFDPATILNAHLFGRAEVAVANAAEAPRTQVPLVLVGTIAAGDPEKGLAILGESAAAARVYAVGATVPGGVRLHSVYADRVVLDRGGALETLPLPRQFAAGTGIASPPAAAAPTGTGAPPIAESVQRLIAQGPEVVGELLRPMPDFADGQLRGFRLYPGRDRQKFAQLGLQPGDLVTQVNGVPLSDPQRGMEILRSLGNAGAATVTVERNGNTQQLSVNASQLQSLGEPREMVQPPRDSGPPTDE